MHMLTKNWRKSESRILWCVTTATLSFSYEKSLCYPSSDKGSLISDKSSFILYRSFIRAPVGTASDRAPSFLLSRLQQKKERWEEAVHSIDFSHSSRKAWRNINKLTGRSGGSTRVCSASAIPSPHKWWRTGHTRLATASSPDSSTNSCPTYGRFHHLRVTVSPNISGRKSLLLPSDAWSQENLRDWTLSSRSLYPTSGRFSNLGSATSSIPACANSKFQRSGEEH